MRLATHFAVSYLLPSHSLQGVRKDLQPSAPPIQQPAAARAEAEPPLPAAPLSGQVPARTNLTRSVVGGVADQIGSFHSL